MEMSLKIREGNYFGKLKLKDEVAIDPLTKVVVRKYITSYVKYLINNNIPFSLAILDIDNFKTLNDTHGHLIGDEILQKVSSVIMDNLDSRAYVGRFGGDEFLLVMPNIVTYSDKWDTLKYLFTQIRNPISIESGLEFNITITGGCATFPDDSKTYEGLFDLADKTLYRGKTKGRDCFIIYVPEKHRNLSFDTMTSLHSKMIKINKCFSGNYALHYEIYESLALISSLLGVDGTCVYEVNKPALMYQENPIPLSYINPDVLNMHYKENIIAVNQRNDLDNTSLLHFYLKEHKIRSCIISKIEIEGVYLGYVLCYSSHNRVWQENDITLSTYLSTIVGYNIYYNKEDIGKYSKKK